MPQEIFLERYNQDFSEEIPISLEEWKSVIKYFDDFRLDEQNTIEAFYEEFDEWQPIFWFSLNNHIFMNARAISFSWYEFAIKIAEHLKAVIIEESGVIIYLPTYGGIYDDEYVEPWNLNIEQIRDNKILFDENFKVNIDKIIKKPLKRLEYHKEEKLSNTQKEELMEIFYSKPSKKWWQFWK